MFVSPFVRRYLQQDDCDTCVDDSLDALLATLEVNAVIGFVILLAFEQYRDKKSVYGKRVLIFLISLIFIFLSFLL